MANQDWKGALTSKALTTPQNIAKTDAPIMKAGATDAVKKSVVDVVDVSVIGVSYRKSI